MKREPLLPGYNFIQHLWLQITVVEKLACSGEELIRNLYWAVAASAMTAAYVATTVGYSRKLFMKSKDGPML
jgi:hypothetical protein